MTVLNTSSATATLTAADGEPVFGDLLATNLLIRPLLSVSTANWGKNAAASIGSATAAGRLIDITGTIGVGGNIFTGDAAALRMPAAPATAYSQRVTVTSHAAAARNLRLSFIFRDAANTSLLVMNSANIPIAPGQTLVLAHANVISPASTATVAVSFVSGSNGVQAGDQFEIHDDWTVVTGASVPFQFNGATAWDDGIGYTWTGTANASTSEAHVVILPLPLEVTSVAVTLDEARAPYVEANLTVALPADPTLLDPRERPRVVVELASTVVGDAEQTATFDLQLHERTMDLAAATATLTCVSDEADLIDLAYLGTEPTQRPGLDVVPFVQWALEQVDAALTEGDTRTEALPSEPVQTAVFNFSHNSSAEYTGGGAAASSNTTLSRAQIAPLFGAWHWKCTSIAAGALGMYAPGVSGTGYGVTPGNRYSISTYARSAAGFSAAVTIRFYDASNNPIGSDYVGAPTVTTGDWARISNVATAPANASYAVAFVLVTATSALQVIDFDGWMSLQPLGPDPTLIDYFDGDFDDTAEYDYSWLAAAGGSASERAWKPNTHAADIEPGQTYWDWLAPILAAAGLRLYCDEARAWHLVDAVTDLDGEIDVSSSTNATGAIDALDLAGDYCDSVVCRYAWTDSNGVARKAYDVAGTGGRTRVVDYTTPFPGTGAAAGILARSQDRARAQTLDVLADLTARPGMALTSHLPGVPDQTGRIAAVTFAWAATGLSDEMTIRARALADA